MKMNSDFWSIMMQVSCKLVASWVKHVSIIFTLRSFLLNSRLGKHWLSAITNLKMENKKIGLE
jgi:hypothetical protein